MSDQTIFMRRPVLTSGASGQDVIALQELLKAAGSPQPPQPDGTYGAQTQSAVIAVQHAFGLEPNRIVGADTWHTLLERTIQFRQPARTRIPAMPVPVDDRFETQTSPSGGGAEFPPIWGSKANLNNFSKLHVPFRWKLNGSTQIASARWQVTRFPVKPSLKTWNDPGGLLASGDAGARPVANTFSEFTIDFGPIVTPPSFDAGIVRLYDSARARVPGALLKIDTDGTFRVAGTATPHLDLSRLPSGAARTSRRSHNRLAVRVPPKIGQSLVQLAGARTTGTNVIWMPGMRVPAGRGANDPSRTPLANSFSMGLFGLNDLGELLPIINKYYIRLVYLTATGTPVAISDTLVIDPVPYEPPPLVIPPPDTTPPPVPATPVTAASMQRYEPEKFTSPETYTHFIVTKDFPPMHWKAGQHVVLTPSSGESFFEQVTEAIEDVGNFIKDAIDWVSTAYNDIKQFAVSAVADFLKSTGIGCGTECQALLRYALESGLAALGMPPSLPNFDQLLQMGRGYLVAYISANTPVPGELALAAAEKLVDAAQQSSKQAAGDPLLVSDPAYLPHPPRLTLRAANTSQAVTPARTLTLTDWNRLFLPVAIPLPPLQPGQSVTIPVNLSYEAAGTDLTGFINKTWQQRLTDGYRFITNFGSDITGNAQVEFNA